VEKQLEHVDWDTVDTSADPAAYVAYLDRLDASPLMQRYRREFLDHLPCCQGDRVLDAGCGTGGDTRQFRDLGGPDGRVLGVDASRYMVRYARAKTQGRVACATGDLRHLPLAEASFDGAICSRVLMHLERPLAAVREIVRILKPSGWLGLCEPDWSKVRLEPDGEISRLVLEAHCAGFASGAVGGRLRDLVLDAGCQVVQVTEQSHAVPDYEKIWSMLNLERTLRQLVEADRFSAGKVQQWRQQMETAARDGAFRIHMAGSICIGRKE